MAAALLLGGCAGPTAGKDDGRLRVVCTRFPYYDFVRAIGGDRVEPYLLVTAGRVGPWWNWSGFKPESH